MKTRITKKQYNALRYKVIAQYNAFRISMLLLTIFFVSILVLANTTKTTIVITANFILFVSVFVVVRSPLRKLDEFTRDGKTYEEITYELDLEKNLPI